MCGQKITQKPKAKKIAARNSKTFPGKNCVVRNETKIKSKLCKKYCGQKCAKFKIMHICVERCAKKKKIFFKKEAILNRTFSKSY